MRHCDDPVVDLKAGVYDIDLPHLIVAESRSECNDYHDLESRIDLFLDNEGVHNVRLQNYLKSVATYQEKLKYEANLSERRWTKKTQSKHNICMETRHDTI